MDFISVDQEKCKHDGICVSYCPHGVIQFSQTDHIPFAVEGMEHRCVSCGHCVAVCPSGALIHKNVPQEQCKPLEENWRLTPEQVGQLFQGRRSTRQYKKQLVDKEVLTQIIDIARYAPTGYNMQPVNWKVIYDPAEVNKIAGNVINWMKQCIQNQHPLAGWMNMAFLLSKWENGDDPICYKVPHLILTYGPKELPISQDSCKMVLTYVELAALSFGLGTCWAGFIQAAAAMSPEFHESLGLPEGYQCFGAMMIGYPKHEFKRIPLRKEAPIVWK